MSDNSEPVGTPEHHLKRAVAYMPVTDQLDAIWKGFNQLRMEGTKLPQDTDDALNHWLKVKREIPPTVTEK